MGARPASRRVQLTALEFFAGSGLVRHGLSAEFSVTWANDNCSKKAAVYSANAPRHPLHLGSITAVVGQELPSADLAWASFPCQDLSLAGNLTGLGRGTRSGLFWEWIRVLDELTGAGKKPPVLVAENVVGFLVANDGLHFKRAYAAMRARGYLVGAVVIDARHFLPQSRQRAFMIAVSDELPINEFVRLGPDPLFHPDMVVRAATNVRDPEWVWWSLPSPSLPVAPFDDLCERDGDWFSAHKTARLIRMLSDHNRAKLDCAIASGDFLAGTGYMRTRPNAKGRKVQRLELRFDGIAGCLRTPEGGSSRQIVIAVDKGKVKARLMSVRECARLMGAPESFLLPGSYNDGYRAMGDGVAVPVTRWLSRHLLGPLATLTRRVRAAESAA